MPPASAVARGFIRHLQALPTFTLGYDFDTIRTLLLQYVSLNFPDWKEFLEDTTGMLYLELMAMISTMLAFRSDFQRAQAYFDTVTDINTFSRLALLTDQKLLTPSPSLLEQIDQVSGAVNIRATRSSPPDSGDVVIQSGTGFLVPTEFGEVHYELFELDSVGNPRYGDSLSATANYFTIINNASSSSDPDTGFFIPRSPSSPFIIVEGTTIIQRFISSGNPDQMFEFSNFPVITDYAHGNYRATVQIQDSTSNFRDTDWHETFTLLDSGATDKHFELEWDGNFKMVLKFGNGVFGKIPAPGSIIWVSYRAGGGSAKRISTKKLNVALSASDSTGSIQIVLNNFAPTLGGGNGDDLAKAKAMYPFRVRQQERIVSPDDFASFAADFSGIAKASAEVLNNDATGNLVRMRIMEYTSTEDGYLRPFESSNVTYLNNNMISNTVVSSSYNATSAITTIVLQDRLGQDFISDYGDVTNHPFTVSVNGVSKQFFIPTVSIGTRTIEVHDDDVTAIFTPGLVVGLANLGSFTMRVPMSAGSLFDVYGPGISKFGTLSYPGDATQWSVAQIDNEFIQFQKEPEIEYIEDGTTRLRPKDDQSGMGANINLVPGGWNGSRVSFAKGASSNSDYEFIGEKKLTIVSRGYNGTEVGSHPINSRVYHGGVRPDLYRAISRLKVQPSNLLLMTGKLLPFYLMLSVRTNTSTVNALLEQIRLTLEEHFNFSDTKWGFGQPIRISPILSLIQNLPGVQSVVYDHATQFTINNTDTTLANYLPINIDEDISWVPSDTVLGLLPYSSAIGTPQSIVSNSPEMTYFLDTGSDVSPENEIPFLRLSGSSGSDFNMLPFSGLLKIKGEIFAYKERIGGFLKGITRDIYGTGSSSSFSSLGSGNVRERESGTSSMMNRGNNTSGRNGGTSNMMNRGNKTSGRNDGDGSGRNTGNGMFMSNGKTSTLSANLAGIPLSYLAVERNPIHLVPNIIISMIGAS